MYFSICAGTIKTNNKQKAEKYMNISLLFAFKVTEVRWTQMVGIFIRPLLDMSSQCGLSIGSDIF